MNAVRVGLTFRALRIKKRLRQADLAAHARCPRSAISKLENGDIDSLQVAQLLRIAEALGATLDFAVRWHGGDLDRLLNARHSQMHESVARLFLTLPGWEIAPEVSFSIYGERGVIDIMCWHAQTRALLVIELKTEIADINELMGTIDRKRRLADRIASERGWEARSVSVWVVVAEGTTNRRRVGAHKAALRSAFPLEGRAMNAWLKEPARHVASLSFWPYAGAGSSNQRLATIKRVRRSPGSPTQA